MGTTVQLDDTLLREAKSLAARRGMSLTALFEEALREKLSCGAEVRGDRPERLPTFRGRGPQPGVDLHRSADLEERMRGAGA
jgi:hypothetical protein